MNCYSQIYLIGVQWGRGPFKIGISTRPEKRAKQLQTAHPRPIVVHGSWRHANPRAVEAEAHRLLAPWHTIGEWFDVSQNRATAAIMQAISHVDSGTGNEFTHDSLALIRNLIMPNAARIPGAENDQFRLGYARHVPGLDLACQVAWLEAYGVFGSDIYIETDARTNSALKNVVREFRPGDRFLVLSREVLGPDQFQTLLETAKKWQVTIQLADEVVKYEGT